MTRGIDLKTKRLTVVAIAISAACDGVLCEALCR